MDALEFELGVSVNVDISVPATYGFGGVRWIQPRTPVAPFLEAGGGVGRIKLSIDRAEIMGIDVSGLIEDELGDEVSDTKFLFVIGGGVNARLATSFSVDAGYRFLRIATEDPAINTSMVYVAIKISR
jgi:opacity protein-like surface antigen